MVKLRELFFVFLRLGALTFGGGMAMLPIIKKDIVERGWIPEDEFIDYIAMAQIAPGMIAINIATLVGKHIRGRIGALVAVVGVALPSLIVITVIASLLTEFAEIAVIHKVLKGIILVVILLLGNAIADMGNKSLLNIYLVIYALACFCAVYFLGFSSVLVIVISFGIGTVHTLVKRGVKK